MQPRPVLPAARSQAAQAVIGEIGCSAVVIMLLATGAGLLLDFQLTDLHPVFSVALTLLAVPAALYWAVRRTLSMSQNRPGQYARNLALTAVAGTAGCLSVVFIFIALFAGVYLDAQLDTHPVFTIGLVLVTVPLSLYLMIRLIMASVGAIKTVPPASTATGAHSASAKTAQKENGS